MSLIQATGNTGGSGVRAVQFYQVPDDFPTPGKTNTLYGAIGQGQLYYWNVNTSTYETWISSDPSLQTVTAAGNTTTRRIKYTGDNLIVSIVTSPITALVPGGNAIAFYGPTLADYVGQSNVVLSLYAGANVVALAEVVTYTIGSEVTPGIYDQELGINITHLIAAADNIDITKFTFFQFDNDALITSREAERRYAPNTIYLALLNQVDTDAPTATVLSGINTLGIVDADYSYLDSKNYYLTKIGAFSLGTIVTILPFGGTSDTPVAAVILDDDTIQIVSPGSNILNNFWFKIERYTVTT